MQSNVCIFNEDNDVNNMKFCYSSVVDRFFYLLYTFIPMYWNYMWNKSIVDDIFNSFEKAGALFIKIGQWLSSRPDLISKDLCDELSKLQESVSYHNSSFSLDIIEENLGEKITDVFSYFEEEAFSSGSIAQIHNATLKNGTEVVVKIVHPNVRKQLLIDHSIMKYVCYVLPFDLEALLEQIRDQANMITEAKNLIRLRKTFENVKNIHVPMPYFANKNIMILEKVNKTTVKDKKQCYMLKLVAFYKMICCDYILHGDMHPGNFIFWEKNGITNMTIIDPSPLIKLKCKNDIKKYLSNLVELSPYKLGMIFYECNTNPFANKKYFLKKLKLIKKSKNLHKIRKKLMLLVRKSELSMNGDITLLIFTILMIQHPTEYKINHLNAIKFIHENDVFDLSSLVGYDISYYLNKKDKDLRTNRL